MDDLKSRPPTPVADGLLDLMARNRDFRLLWWGNLISACGGWFTSVSVFAMLYEHTGTALAAGASLAVRYLPGIVFGTWGGVLADRVDRRAVMLIGDAVMAVLALAFLLADSPAAIWLVYPLTFASAAAGFVFQAARGAWMPSLVQPQEYVLYSAAVQVNGLLFQAVGGLAGAAAVALIGWRWAFAVNALSFLLSLYFTAKVRRGARRGDTSPDAARGWAAFREGLAAARGNRVVSALLLLEAVFCLGLGGSITAMTYLATQVHGLGEGGVGWFYAAQGITGAAVLLLAARRLKRLSSHAKLVVLGWSCVGEGVFTAALGLPSGVGAALALWACAAAADVVYGPTSMSALLDGAPNAVRGRVVSLWSAVATASMGVSALVSGALLDTLGPALLLPALGTLMALPGALWLLALRRGTLTPPP
ncbi:Predicted arabinose efflux permease, MFS family [Sinosporangium album]|uniref:Predicted arabinose efflux permease, MFS family n=1 Tax=Sinosporangium album TaxID=504805 RepID=A0A1G7ZSP8_9ACTN|nr:MFS transporter [Sinosporangium album]SDH11719.1 Predicted arabinose efflux permease, MFS family [Sinosporangium album]